MADRKPALRIENKTGIVRDTKIMLNGEDVTAAMGVQRLQIIAVPEGDTIRVVMECIDAEIDIAALDGVIKDHRSGAEYPGPKAASGSEADHPATPKGL